MRWILILLLLMGCTIVVNEEIPKNASVATFAGGCFWCMEAAMQIHNGVYEAVTGYTGGHDKDPTYNEVSSGSTGHYEAVQVYYDSSKVTYEELLDIFWKSIDPTDDGGQFADRGSQYLTAIFYHDEEQKKLAEESKEKMQSEFDKPIVTEILPAEEFFEAEEYHQDYSEKKTAAYKIYETASGRKGYLKDKWKK